MKAYEIYKPINLPWLQHVPSHWDIVRNKVVMNESKTTVGDESSKYTLLSLTKGGVIIRDLTQMKGKFPSDFGTYKTVTDGQIIFCLFDVDETPRTVGLSQYSGMITGAYDVFDVSGINPYYLQYYYISLDDVKAMRPLYTGLRKVIGMTTFLQANLPLPPRVEQDQIVRYLDWKVSQINKIINAKKKQIALLQEQKQAVINRAVTKGLDPDVGMKDSGIKWLGDIPAQWEICRCKYLFSERNERSEKGTETHLSMSQKYGLVSDEQLDERRMLSESYAGAKLCYTDDLVLNRLKAHLGVFAVAPHLGVISPDYTVLKPNVQKIIPIFALYVLKSEPCRRELRIRVQGVVEGFWRLYTNDFNTIVLPLPSLDEQQAILDWIKYKAEKMDLSIATIQKEITLLHEYRTHLTGDVVTGKLDVRDVQVPDYEAVEEVVDTADIDTDETEGEDDGD